MAAVGAAIAIAGCSSSPTTQPSTPPSSSPTVAASEAANGTTVRVAVGAVVQVILHSTYWHFAADASPGVLRRSRLVSEPDSSPPRIPGSGRGTVVATFVALSPGSTAIRATRTSCGEALRCVGARGSYRLTVVVR